MPFGEAEAIGESGGVILECKGRLIRVGEPIGVATAVLIMGSLGSGDDVVVGVPKPKKRRFNDSIQGPKREEKDRFCFQSSHSTQVVCRSKIPSKRATFVVLTQEQSHSANRSCW